VKQVLLQLGQGANHDCVFEVARYRLFELLHVVSRELSHAVSEQAARLTVRNSFLINDFLDVLFTVLQVCNDLFEVFEQQALAG